MRKKRFFIGLLCACFLLCTEWTLAQDEQEPELPRIYARIREKTLPILLEENSSSLALIELLKAGDVVVEMRDYGGFEKVGDLPEALPTNDERITTQPGDVILYQGNSITIYYDVNTWTFTRLGCIQDCTQEELMTILGDGDVSVTFSLESEPPSEG